MKQTKKSETYPRVHKDKESIFSIVQMEKENFRIALGNQIVEDKVFKTKQEAQKHIDQKSWDLMINVFCVVSLKMYELQKEEKNEKAK